MSLSASALTEHARALGFDLVGCVPIAHGDPRSAAFFDWLQAGHHGTMDYMARAPERRADPTLLLPGCTHIIMVGASYQTLDVPAQLLQDPARGRIARYAWGADYHDVLLPRLRKLADFVAPLTRSYIDIGAVLERGWADRAGLGFVGKNTCLISRRAGSFLFLGAILVAGDIETITATPSRRPQTCGACTRCLDACPTSAFESPYVLNARKCISYLTIEAKGPIPAALAAQTGNWLFGCDICQDVCPFVRRFSQVSRIAELMPVSAEACAPFLQDILALDGAGFNTRFKHTPLARAKRRGLLRNACAAAANSRLPFAEPALTRLLADDEPLIRQQAEIGLAQLANA